MWCVFSFFPPKRPNTEKKNETKFVANILLYCYIIFISWQSSQNAFYYFYENEINKKREESIIIMGRRRRQRGIISLWWQFSPTTQLQQQLAMTSSSSSYTIETEGYLEQKHGRWPRAGKVILAHHTSEAVVVYQAFHPDIGSYAVQHKRFLGCPSYSPTRMTWIKTNFLWMMYR